MEPFGDPSESIKRFGLTEIYTPASPALVDVVFVHGLDGHPYRTWASEVTKTFWPAQLLPPILREEEARILVYGYNADVTPVVDEGLSEYDKHHSRHCKLSRNYDGSMDEPRDQRQCLECERAEASNELRAFKQLSLKSKDKIHNHAELLLAELYANRRKQKATERPIIFVAHSLGGLIVKRALVFSSEIRFHKTAHLRSIYVSTYGILFLGTPHQGFDIETWISRYERTRSSMEFPKHIDFRPQIIHSLGIKHETLENIDRHFIQLSNKIRIYFFYEGKPTRIHGNWDYVVEMESAAPIIQDVECTSIQQDHTHMCQFENTSSPGFDVVTEAIQRYASEAPKKIQADWHSERAEDNLRIDSQVRELRIYDSNHIDKAVDTSSGRIGDWSISSGVLESNILPISQQKRHYLVPRQRVKHFVGRKAQLLKISSHFATGREGNRPQVLILHALGGQGKSQIAIEYCQSSREEYAGIFWVNANSEDSTLQSYARIAAALNVNSSAEHSERRKAVRIVIDYLESWDQRWLLVFDNYDMPEEFPNIHEFVPEFGQGHIIFTSRRNQDLDRLGTLLEIPAMDVDEGISLLLRGHSDQDIKPHLKIASKIVDRLGGLPLAIDQAAAYIRYQRLPLHQLDTFLKIYDVRRAEILSHIPLHFWEYGTMQIHGEEEQKKALNAFTTWELSLEQLKTGNTLFSNEMTHFLTLSAFFNPTRIEEWLFRHYSDRYHCIEECAVWQLLFSAPDEESIDGSHDGSRQGRDDKSYQGSENKSYQGSDDYSHDGSVDASNLESNNKIEDENYDDHYDGTLSDHASDASSVGLECECRWDSVKFWDMLSRFYDLSLVQSLELHSDSATFSLHPLIRDWLQFREEDSRRSMVIESVAVVVASVELNESQPMSLEKRNSLLAHIDACVMGDEQFTEEQHQLGHDIQNCGNARSLAHFYIEQGFDEAAEKLLPRIYATQIGSLGMEHVDTLDTMSLYATLLFNRGKYIEAERIECQIVQVQTRLLGEEHESTLDSLECLALISQRQYKYNEAENIQRQLLQIHEKKSGKRNLYTIECSTDLAETLRLQGKSGEAEEMQRETLHLSESLLGTQHRNTIRIMFWLSVTLKDQQKYEEAEKLGREVLQLRETLSGKQHPNTLLAMHNLAKTLFHRGKTEEAVNLCRDVLELRGKVLGKSHPYTLNNMHDLAWMLSHDESSLDEAEQLCRQVLVLMKEVLGREHPHTLYSMSLLGQILSQHESSYPEAEEILRETCQLRKKVLGSEHKSTLYSMSWLGWLLSQHETSYHEAEQILRETCQLQKRVLGDEHSDTIATMSDLADVMQRQGKSDNSGKISQQSSPRTTEMKITPDNSFDIESSGAKVPLPGRAENSRKKKRWLSNIRKHFKKGYIDAHRPIQQPATE